MISKKKAQTQRSRIRRLRDLPARLGRAIDKIDRELSEDRRGREFDSNEYQSWDDSSLIP